MRKTFEDHFSGHAEAYAAHRPTYPRALFEFLAAAAPARRLAWDCATGSGQAAVALGEHFEQVVATDASARQLAAARPHERVVYRCEPATATSLAAASCDLVTVAQAVHWFAGERFDAEVRRVARRGGVVAVWTYTLLRVDPEVDALIDRFKEETVGNFWPPQRRLVDAAYATLPFPYAELETPQWVIERQWSVDEALGYLATWSAVRRYAAEQGTSPLAAFGAELRAAWGGGARPVRWPLAVRAGRLE